MSSKPFKFEPSDFAAIHKEAVKNGYASYNAGDMWEPTDTLKMLVDAANAKLAQWRAQATVVYGKPEVGAWTDIENKLATHRALLIDIQELPKEPCKHEPPELTPLQLLAAKQNGFTQSSTHCRHCGVKLRAEWKEES